MTKKESSTSKNNDSKGQVRKGHVIGDSVSPRAWQPTTDRTTKPPKSDENKK